MAAAAASGLLLWASPFVARAAALELAAASKTGAGGKERRSFEIPAFKRSKRRMAAIATVSQSFQGHASALPRIELGTKASATKGPFEANSGEYLEGAVLLPKAA
jgi:hypothetical protein